MMILIGKGDRVETLAAALSHSWQSRGYKCEFITNQQGAEKCCVVSVKNTKWYYWLGGQGLRARVSLQTTGNDITYKVGGELWIDKVVLVTFALFYRPFAIVLPAVLVGVVRQVQLIQDLVNAIKQIHSQEI